MEATARVLAAWLTAMIAFAPMQQDPLTRQGSERVKLDAAKRHRGADAWGAILPTPSEAGPNAGFAGFIEHSNRTSLPAVEAQPRAKR